MKTTTAQKKVLKQIRDGEAVWCRQSVSVDALIKAGLVIDRCANNQAIGGNEKRYILSPAGAEIAEAL